MFCLPDGYVSWATKKNNFAGSICAPCCRKGHFVQIGVSQDTAAYLRTKLIEPGKRPKQKGLGDPVEVDNGDQSWKHIFVYVINGIDVPLGDANINNVDPLIKSNEHEKNINNLDLLSQWCVVVWKIHHFGIFFLVTISSSCQDFRSNNGAWPR